MIKALLLDLDNTLIDRDAAFAAWLASRSTGIDRDALIAMDRGGYGDKRALFTALGRALGISAARARAAHDDELLRFVTLAPDTAKWLDSFHGAKVVVTNGASELQRAKIRAADLTRHIDAIVVSSEHGHDKPHPSIFHHALALAGARPHDALMIGDHPVSDVLGARAVGISACMLRTKWFDVPAGVNSIARLSEARW